MNKMEIEHILTAKNINYHPTYNGALQLSNKAVVGSNFLEDFLITPQPCYIKITPLCDGDIGKIAYVSIQEFTAPLNTIFLSLSTMNDCFIPEDTQVIIEQIFPPTISKINLNTKDVVDSFHAKQDTHPSEAERLRRDIEKEIISKYQILQLNDVLRIKGQNFSIVELEPSHVVSCYNSEPHVIFSSFGVKSSNKSSNKRSSAITCNPPDNKKIKTLSKPSQRQPKKNYSTRKSCKSFPGEGRKLC